MNYHSIDETINRRGSGSMKWDEVPEDVLPLWVADMDFPVAPAIQRAVAERAAHPVFGYTLVGDAYYEAIISWFQRRHNWEIKREWIVYTQGVVPAISCAIKALTLPGDKVLVMTPVYNCFFSCIRNQGCQIEESPLQREGERYVIDYDDLERRCQDEKVSVLLFCNPHNPTGRVWTAEEMRRVGEICQRHGVTVISDEIHCEIVLPGFTFTPFAKANMETGVQCVTLNSPSKSFNTAGLQIANIICTDAQLLRRIERVVNIFEVCDVNPFGPVALIAAYNEGEEWLKRLNEKIAENYNYLRQFVLEEMPQAQVIHMEGTYLAWIDVNCYPLTSQEIADVLERQAKVKVSAGTVYGERAGQGYIRLNLACQPDTLKQALIRIARTLTQYDEECENQGCPA